MSATVQVKERPILFSGEMVRAILDGHKTQTRRVVKPQPAHRLVEPKVGLTVGMDPADDGAVWYDADGIHPGREVRCPYGRPLDRLWVREAFALVGLSCDFESGYVNDWWDEDVPVSDPRATPRFLSKPTRALWYRATWEGDDDRDRGFRWRPSIHMPRWASRITLEITDVRVERVREISEEDARAEGVLPIPHNAGGYRHDAGSPYRAEFATLWDSLNGPRGYGWDANPWVWALTFRRVEDDR